MWNSAVASGQASPCRRRASACEVCSCSLEGLVTGTSCACMEMTSYVSWIVGCLLHWMIASETDAKSSPPRANGVAEAVGRQARMSLDLEPVHGSCHGHHALGVVGSVKGSCCGQSHALHRGMCLDHLVHHGSYRCGHHHPVHGETRHLPASCELLRQLCRPRSVGVLPSAYIMEWLAIVPYACLLLYELELFGLEQLLWNALWAGLGTQTEVPELLAEGGSVLVEEAGQLDLERLDIGLNTEKIS